MEKWKCSLSDKQLAKKCDDWIRSLIDTGGKSWCLNIPARPNEDPDLVFSELVRRFRGKDGDFPEPDLPGSKPSKKIKKKPTGILKDLLELKRYSVLNGVHVRDLCGTKVIKVEDVEAIINKYSHP